MARPKSDVAQSVLSGLFGSIKDVAGPLLGDLAGKAIDALPECLCCNSKSIPLRCFICGSYTCKDHGYHSFGKMQSICDPCLRQLLGEAGAGEGIADLDPWAVLGIDPGATKQQVERAFRLKARECHPDTHPNDSEKAREFRRIQWAKETILEQMRG